MLCPKCLIQMHQLNKLGGGKTSEKFYETWEIKECPGCLRKFIEYYSAAELK